MTDYGRIFGEEVAQGLGLWAPPLVPASAEEYAADPASAFTQMAEAFHPGGDIPVPFAQVVTPPTFVHPHARTPRPA